MVACTRLVTCSRTRAYRDRHAREQLSPKDILRYLKCYLGREVYRPSLGKTSTKPNFPRGLKTIGAWGCFRSRFDTAHIHLNQQAGTRSESSLLAVTLLGLWEARRVSVQCQQLVAKFVPIPAIGPERDANGQRFAPVGELGRD